ncbi:MAG: acid phosphatase [Candidatus Rokuibacteriota bacterium]|nr:MAG: acid phosphatase [Candidatus Rokubacteria bacterium]
MNVWTLRWLGSLLTALGLLAPRAVLAQSAPDGLRKIEHIVVIYLENRSFDHLFGNFPGANGLANAGEAALQVDETGQPYDVLPDPLDLRKKPYLRYAALPEKLPNRPFRLNDYFRLDEQLGSLVHAFYQQQAQINGGKMNRFAAASDAKGYALAYWDTTGLRLWDYARRYTLADNFFHAAFGGSFLNHFWLVCACTPVYPSAPEKIVAKLDAAGKLVKDGAVTPDGHGVNTMEPIGGPHGHETDPALLLPVQTMATIGNRLSEKGVAWAWYSGGWNEAEAGTLKGDTFSFHHQPFAFFQRFQKGRPDRARHLKDLEDLVRDVDKGTLPAVAFYKPRRGINQHPSASDVLTSDRHVGELLDRLEKSPQWGKMAVIVTYDENGGFWDHVAPPRRDRWGPGTRVPALVVSPFARKGFVDHTLYDTTSILRLIETRFGLAPLGEADAKANDMLQAFAF